MLPGLFGDIGTVVLHNALSSTSGKLTQIRGLDNSNQNRKSKSKAGRSLHGCKKSCPLLKVLTLSLLSFLPSLSTYNHPYLPACLLTYFPPSLPTYLLPSLPPSLLPSLPLNLRPSFSPSLPPSLSPSLPPYLPPSLLTSTPLNLPPSYLSCRPFTNPQGGITECGCLITASCTVSLPLVTPTQRHLNKLSEDNAKIDTLYQDCRRQL